MKKYFTIAMVLFVFALLAGCENASTPPPEPTSSYDVFNLVGEDIPIGAQIHANREQLENTLASMTPGQIERMLLKDGSVLTVGKSDTKLFFYQDGELLSPLGGFDFESVWAGDAWESAYFDITGSGTLEARLENGEYAISTDIPGGYSESGIQSETFYRITYENGDTDGRIFLSATPGTLIGTGEQFCFTQFGQYSAMVEEISLENGRVYTCLHIDVALENMGFPIVQLASDSLPADALWELARQITFHLPGTDTPVRPFEGLTPGPLRNTHYLGDGLPVLTLGEIQQNAVYIDKSRIISGIRTCILSAGNGPFGVDPVLTWSGRKANDAEAVILDELLPLDYVMGFYFHILMAPEENYLSYGYERYSPLSGEVEIVLTEEGIPLFCAVSTDGIIVQTVLQQGEEHVFCALHLSGSDPEELMQMAGSLKLAD
ncbi:hypothetical protein LJC32_05205 [Oscillospiraceae bacterium OttesenSCG-928-F05]|nr:hypothetical protein [Oscillospiraceae bacterium OttesenSCG-928-F05]